MLVCIYYRVAAGDLQRVISGVREFQRTLRKSDGVDGAEVLLRCDLPMHGAPAVSATQPDDRPASLPSHDPPAGDARVDPGAEATVMETYRLSLPAVAGPEADAVVRGLLATLESAARPHAGLLRGARHVELFAPCAS
jgi:hypothetical protein